jgi:hypothetical protein
MSTLRLQDLIVLKSAGESVLKVLPKAKRSAAVAKRLKEAIKRAEKAIKEAKNNE